jgi:hypothetical protein
MEGNDNDSDVVSISLSRSCEHFTVDVSVTGNMPDDMQMSTLARVGRAVALIITGDDPACASRLGEPVGSMTLENPTEESMREALETMIKEASEHIRKHMGGQDGN